jgi:hypothetical protein
MGHEVTEPLATFTARIDEELLYDDGIETASVFVISGRTKEGEELRPLRVPTTEFPALTWVTSGWGAAAVVEAGNGTRDHLRAAILKLSKPRRRRIYRRTGWTEIGNRWAFLYHGGSVGADGIEVELDPPLDRFRLPPVAENVPDAIRASLSLLDCGPRRVTVPLLGAVYLAPVAFILRPDATTWLYGRSGSLKSELASLAQAHFGAFDRKSLPASWSSTDNSLESRLTTLADVLVTIDDFAPQADARADREQQQRAQRILRGVGNHSGRGRMRADLTHRPDRPPRGLALCTGESLPQGESINARLVAVEIDRDDLNLDAVSALQAGRELLPNAMRAYLSWLCECIPGMRSSLPRRWETLRASFRSAEGHLRQADALAHTLLGIELFADFALDTKVLTDDDVSRLRSEAREALLTLAGRQHEAIVEVSAAERFLQAISTLLAQGRAHLQPVTDGPFPAPGTMIGYRTATSALLIPDAAYREVALHVRDQGFHWAPAAAMLHKELVRKRYVLPDPEGRPIAQRRIGNGRRPRVLEVPLLLLAGDGGGPAADSTADNDNGAGGRGTEHLLARGLRAERSGGGSERPADFSGKEPAGAIARSRGGA